jgi:hypothetical protein
MSRGEQVPEGAAADDIVAMVLEILVAEGAAELVAALETEGATELEAALETEGATELEAAFELEGAKELGEPPVAPEQAKLMLLIVHVTVVEEKPDQVIPVMALALAPAKVLKGMLTT